MGDALDARFARGATRPQAGVIRWIEPARQGYGDGPAEQLAGWMDGEFFTEGLTSPNVPGVKP